MKTASTLLVLVFAIILFAFKNKEEEHIKTLSVSYFNYAERGFDGTWIYSFKNDSIIVKKQFLFAKKDTTLLSIHVDQNPFKNVKKSSLYNLPRFNDNECIMLTSGNLYFLSFEKHDSTETVSFHHYYHPTLDSIIGCINKIIPEEYRHNYLSPETEQNCK